LAGKEASGVGAKENYHNLKQKAKNGTLCLFDQSRVKLTVCDYSNQGHSTKFSTNSGAHHKFKWLVEGIKIMEVNNSFQKISL